MKLILVRHGQAVPAAAKDQLRDLTELGINQARLTGQYIVNHYDPELIITSPYNRARQTAAQIEDVYGKLERSCPKSHVYDNITPSDDHQQALEYLANIDAKCMLVVCHMDIIARLDALITGEAVNAFSLAEARVYKYDVLAAGLGAQIDTFTPEND